jgi:hypothetical protein
MKKVSATLFGVVILSAAAALSSAPTPALALGGCGPNQHVSSVSGRCIWGGQNQAWCLRHTGHTAIRVGNRKDCVR